MVNGEISNKILAECVSELYYRMISLKAEVSYFDSQLDRILNKLWDSFSKEISGEDHKDMKEFYERKAKRVIEKQENKNK